MTISAISKELTELKQVIRKADKALLGDKEVILLLNARSRACIMRFNVNFC